MGIEIEGNAAELAAIDAALRGEPVGDDASERARAIAALFARHKKAEEIVALARALSAYSWEDRLEDCKVSDDAKHDSRELGIAVWLYDQDANA